MLSSIRAAFINPGASEHIANLQPGNNGGCGPATAVVNGALHYYNSMSPFSFKKAPLLKALRNALAANPNSIEVSDLTSVSNRLRGPQTHHVTKILFGGAFWSLRILFMGLPFGLSKAVGYHPVLMPQADGHEEATQKLETDNKQLLDDYTVYLKDVASDINEQKKALLDAIKNDPVLARDMESILVNNDGKTVSLYYYFFLYRQLDFQPDNTVFVINYDLDPQFVRKIVTEFANIEFSDQGLHANSVTAKEFLENHFPILMHAHNPDSEYSDAYNPEVAMYLKHIVTAEGLQDASKVALEKFISSNETLLDKNTGSTHVVLDKSFYDRFVALREKIAQLQIQGPEDASITIPVDMAAEIVSLLKQCQAVAKVQEQQTNPRSVPVAGGKTLLDRVRQATQHIHLLPKYATEFVGVIGIVRGVWRLRDHNPFRSAKQVFSDAMAKGYINTIFDVSGEGANNSLDKLKELFQSGDMSNQTLDNNIGRLAKKFVLDGGDLDNWGQFKELIQQINQGDSSEHSMLQNLVNRLEWKGHGFAAFCVRKAFADEGIGNAGPYIPKPEGLGAKLHRWVEANVILSARRGWNGVFNNKYLSWLGATRNFFLTTEHGLKEHHNMHQKYLAGQAAYLQAKQRFLRDAPGGASASNAARGVELAPVGSYQPPDASGGNVSEQLLHPGLPVSTQSV